LNCNYDNDIINYSGDELLDKINEYLALNDVNIIISDNMNRLLFPTSKKYKYMNIPKLINENKHDGKILWKYILNDHYCKFYNKYYIFDYDYTIFNKDNMKTSHENIKCLQKLTNKYILTNNCISNILPIDNSVIYSNIANIKTVKGSSEIIDTAYILNDSDIEEIKRMVNHLNIDTVYNLEIRKNVSISIKPINDRDIHLLTFNTYFSDTNYEAIKTGKTTIEIVKKGLSKRNTFLKEGFLTSDYTYITDMNDIKYDSKNDTIKYLEVKDITNTNLFLTSILMNTKYDYCIIVGGINTRMNTNYPKCLVKHNNEIVLLKMINQIYPYVNKIYICANNHYKQHFLDFQRLVKDNKQIEFLYFNSIDNLQDYPKGNGETIYQLINKVELTNKIFISWGDVILSSEKIIEEMYNLQYGNDFLIPTLYEENPYAYLIINKDGHVDKIEYKRNKPIDFGYHDQCIFLCARDIIQNNLHRLINIYINDDINFLDVVKYIPNVSYYTTNFPVHSFNTLAEKRAINSFI
jgi:molybdopterin-guanine dinucleotide biosynthesis protein A